VPDLRVHCKLWMSSDTSEGSFGTGKVRLLKAVDEAGSLQEAARMLGISYRKAWADLKKAEECLQCKLIEKMRGGRGGGRTVLTEQGRGVTQAFSTMERSVLQNLRSAHDVFMEEVGL
jgi:molybdate transport system regulatory protein